MQTSDSILLGESFFGHMRLVTTERWDGKRLILGGYSISYDRQGNEIRRTKDEPNVVVIFP